MKKILTFLLGVFGIAIIGVLCWYIGIDDIYSKTIHATENTKLPLLFLVLIVLLLEISIYALAWKMVIKVSRINLSFFKVLNLYLTGMFGNNITPFGGVGGEPLRVYFFEKLTKQSIGHCYAIMAAEKIIYGFAFFVLLVIGLLVMYFTDIEGVLKSFMLGTLGLFILVCIFFGYLFTNKNFCRKFILLIVSALEKLPGIGKKASRFREDVDSNLNRFYLTLEDVLSKKTKMIIPFLLMILAMVVSIFKDYFIFYALGINFPIQYLFIIMPFVIVVSMIPITPGSLGVVESGKVGLFMAFGLPPAIAMAVTLIERFFSYWLLTFMGFVSSIYLKFYTFTHNSDK